MIFSLFLSVGITGLEPATSRPPEVNSNGLNPDESQRLTLYHYLSVDFVVDFSPPND